MSQAHRRMITARTPRLPTTREAVILAILLEQERYGVEISRLYHQRTGRPMPAGSLYATLGRMQQKGLIALRRERSAATGRGRRTYFSITPRGRQALKTLETWMRQMRRWCRLG